MKIKVNRVGLSEQEQEQIRMSKLEAVKSEQEQARKRAIIALLLREFYDSSDLSRFTYTVSAGLGRRRPREYKLSVKDNLGMEVLTFYAASPTYPVKSNGTFADFFGELAKIDVEK